jgi:hypothetical protein
MLWLVELRSLDQVVQSEPLPLSGLGSEPRVPKKRSEAARPPQVNQDSPDPEGVL